MAQKSAACDGDFSASVYHLADGAGIHAQILSGAMKMLDMTELEAGLEQIRQSPKDHGVLELIVCRPAKGERQILQEARLELSEGVVGDTWKTRGSNKTTDGSAHPEMQV